MPGVANPGSTVAGGSDSDGRSNGVKEGFEEGKRGRGRARPQEGPRKGSASLHHPITIDQHGKRFWPAPPQPAEPRLQSLLQKNYTDTWRKPCPPSDVPKLNSAASAAEATGATRQKAEVLAQPRQRIAPTVTIYRTDSTAMYVPIVSTAFTTTRTATRTHLDPSRLACSACRDRA